MNRKRIMIIDVLDHFTTDSNEIEVIARYIGEYVGENDRYITLKHITANILVDYKEEVNEVSKLVKSAIKNKWEGYIDIDPE